MTYPTKFDYYSATVFGNSPEWIVQHFLERFPQTSQSFCIPKKPYERAYKIARDDQTYCVISYGGINEGVHVESKSNAHITAPVIKQWSHQVSRVDSCIDVIEPFFYEWVTDEFKTIAKQNNLALEFQGDWERSKARTLYVGSTKSVFRICIYEKGQKEKLDPNWVRIETRFRPQKKQLKQAASTLDSEQVFRLPKWIKPVCKKIGMNYEEFVLPSVWQPSDKVQASYHMVLQYKRILENLNEDTGGWEQVGDLFEQAIESIDNGDIPSKTMQIISDKIRLEVV